MNAPRTLAESDDSPRAAVIECTADDMVLDRCEGCGVGFPPVPGKPFASLDARDRHARTCIAYRDYVIATKLAAQACDDGRDDDAGGTDGGIPVSDTVTRSNAEIADALASLPRDGPLVLITRAVVEEAILALRAPRVFTVDDVETAAAAAWNSEPDYIARWADAPKRLRTREIEKMTIALSAIGEVEGVDG